MMKLALQLMQCLALVLINQCQALSNSATYDGAGFTHMELYRDAGSDQELLLVAQKNGLLRFKPDLSRSSFTKIGPLNDSQSCMPHQIHQGMASCNLAATDNYIRALDIVNGSQLYFCMSYLSGSCTSVRLTGLDAPMVVNTSAVAALLSESVGGLLCRNPESEVFLTVSDRSLGVGGGASVPDALYLTMPFCASRPDKIEPTLAIVDAKTSQKYSVSEDFNYFQAEIVSRRDFIRPGGLTHHASFRRVSLNSQGRQRICVYFVLTARSGRLRLPRLRLARLCSDDLTLSNYVEAFVDCGGCGVPTEEREETACVGQAATLAPVGDGLAQQLNPGKAPEHTDALFVTSCLSNNRSGVCVFQMSLADQLLDDILEDCRTGRPLSRYGPAYLREEAPCSPAMGPSGGGVGSGGRGLWAGIFSLSPERVLRAPFLIEIPPAGMNDEASALASVATSRGDTLIYVGTRLGRLLAYRVGPASAVHSTSHSNKLFFESQVGDDKVLAVRAGEDRLFALTASQIYSQPYANCEQEFHTCSTCLSVSNPHCLWSNLPGSNGGCRTIQPRQPLNKSDEDLFYYLTDRKMCANVDLISHEGIDIDRLRRDGKLDESALLRIENAPRGLRLYCRLGAGGTFYPTAVASVRYNGSSAEAACRLRTEGLVQLLGNQTSRQVAMHLSVNAQPDQPALVSARLLVFACSGHSSCASCSQGGGGSRCGWCAAEGVCRTAGSQCRIGDSQVTETLISTAKHCPVIRLPSSASTAAPVLPSGGAVSLNYAAIGLKDYMRQFYCVVSCPGVPQPQILPATFTKADQQLKCQIPSGSSLTYSSDSLPNVTCSISFQWTSSRSSGGQLQLDVDGLAGSLVLYKCQAMAASCDACVLNVPSRFGCVWCGQECAVEAVCTAANRVNHGGLCANPQLASVRPAKLAPRPNLRLRADGSNLGNSPNSLSARLLASATAAPALNCRILTSSYQPGRSFACQVLEAPLEDAGDYRLEVTILGLANGTTAKALSAPLPVRLPLVKSVTPTAVQRDGRVVVHLGGANLDAGSDLFVTWRLNSTNESGQFGDLKLAVSSDEVLERSEDSMTVKLGIFHSTGTYSPVLSVQGSLLENSPAEIQPFLTVMPNVKPTFLPNDIRLGLIPAGGLDFVVSGDGLSIVRRAFLRLVELTNGSDVSADNNQQSALTLESPCQLMMIRNNTQQLVCSSPSIPPFKTKTIERRLRRNVIEEVQPTRRFSASIWLDALSHPYPAPALTLYPNPTLEPLSPRAPVLLESASDASLSRELQLFGRGLLRAVQPADIRVTIGSASCQSVNPIRGVAAADGLEVFSCQFRLSESDLNRPLLVRATIGHLNFELGFVTFMVRFPWAYVYVGLGVGSMLIVAALTACCIHVQQRYKKRRDKASGIEFHLNKMEANVSKSCREAFAELQLNSSPDGLYWTDDLTAPAPVRTYGQFAAYSCFAERYKDRFIANDYLFADVATEEAANGNDSQEVRKALGQFRHLLLNEDFLLTLIAALESRTDSFMHQERNHFGSLLSALLFSDPTYFTRILTTLIRQLIERKRDAHDNSKVTFRRCDSVAERLLPNWLAFLMYDHLATRVAEPLYRLNREMRLQIYRGPVDQITEDSRYTINEQKLLKKEITFRPMTLVFHDRLRQFSDNAAEPLQCKVSVLDCDTVRQAKEKILDTVYTRLRVPASSRIPASHFDLIRVGAPPNGDANEQNYSGERGFQVLPEVDDLDPCSDGIQRLRRMSCLNLDEASPPGNNNDSSNNTSTVTSNGGPYWVYLRPRKNAGSSMESTRRGLCKGASYADMGSLPGGVISKSLQDMKHISSSYSRLATAATRQYHLIQPSGATSHTLDRSTKKRRRGGRMKKSGETSSDVDNQQIVSEVLYPILLSTKKNLVDKITDLFAALFPTDQELQQQLKQLKRQSTAVSTDHEQQQLVLQQLQTDIPQCLVYLFDLLDQLATKERCDKASDVAHVWKSNALMLRFYTHHLMNVEYLLDVEVPGPVRYCMSTVSTLFMDACSAEQPKKPDKTSTAQRLLFCNEIVCLHQRVSAYYASVRKRYRSADSAAEDNSLLTAQQPLPPPPRDCRPFNAGPLLKELFGCFVFKYFDDVIRHLQQQRVSDSLIANLQSIALVLGAESNLQIHQQQQHQQHHQSTLSSSGSRDRKKRSNSRPALDSNAYDY